MGEVPADLVRQIADAVSARPTEIRVLNLATEGEAVFSSPKGLGMVRAAEIVEFVPWVAVEHMNFVARSRCLRIEFTRADALAQELSVQGGDIADFMEYAKALLEPTIVVVRERRTASGAMLCGTVRKAPDGQLLLFINARDKQPVSVAEVDDFEKELRELVGMKE